MVGCSHDLIWIVLAYDIESVASDYGTANSVRIGRLRTYRTKPYWRACAASRQRRAHRCLRCRRTGKKADGTEDRRKALHELLCFGRARRSITIVPAGVVRGNLMAVRS